MTGRAYYSDPIDCFLDRSSDEILGTLVRCSAFSVESTQRDAWVEQIRILKFVLKDYRVQGNVYFEYSVPRLGKRIDVVVLLRHVIFVLEFKVGESGFTSSAVDQSWDYALDLKNFHETTHDKSVVPVVVATLAPDALISIETSAQDDSVYRPVLASPGQLTTIFEQCLAYCVGMQIDPQVWESGRYHPTPTIIEAAMALYGGHAVSDISRNDASAVNLGKTSEKVSEIIQKSKLYSRKSICFVTGVPGAGKTLVGLNIATNNIDRDPYIGVDVLAAGLSICMRCALS